VSDGAGNTGGSVIDSGVANGTFQAKVKTGENPSAVYLVFRYKDDGDFIAAGVYTGDDKCWLVKEVAGTPTTINTAAVTGGIAASTWYTITIVASDTSIIVSVDGTQYLSETVAEHTAETMVGFMEAAGNQTAYMDDLSVTP